MVVKNVKPVLGRFTLLTSAAAAVAVVGLLMNEANSQGSIIKVDGSSTVYPITEKVAEGFQKTAGAKVTVGISGTGGGFKKFCAGETDIANASRPIKEKEVEACKQAGIEYIEIPVAYDALTVVVNPANPISNITVDELKKMWEPAAQGTITKWNQVNPSWPDAKLTLYSPGTDSGTFEYFTEEVVGKARSSRTDVTPSEDDNVLVQGVSRNKNAIGYFGYAYYEANQKRLKALKVDGVAPSIASVEDGSYKPLARPIFIYVKAASAQRPEVKSFMEYYLKNANKIVADVKYVPLKANQYTAALDKFKAGKTGTAYNGGKAKPKIDQVVGLK